MPPCQQAQHQLDAVMRQNPLLVLAAGADKAEARKARLWTAEAHARFRHASGDALSALSALCAYMAIPPSQADAFCR